MKSPVKSGKGPAKVKLPPEKNHGAMPKGKVDQKDRGKSKKAK